jgi:hypothetical protein
LKPLIPIALFGLPLVSILLFRRFKPDIATVITVLAGFLFLPMASYDLPVIPAYDKTTSIAVGLILGGMISGHSAKHKLRLTAYDIPMIVWCFVAPVMASLTNGLGLYDGLSGLFTSYFSYGVIYWAGRKYFVPSSSLRILTMGVLVGGLAYVPLDFFEVRMSPQLSNIVYGFFPHSFLQGVRYGGYRPIVFMQHFLQVSLWMAVATMACFWIWRVGGIKKVRNVSIAFLFLLLAAATVLCKSANGMIFFALGIAGTIYYKKTGSTFLFKLILLIVPLYILLRLVDVISVKNIQNIASAFVDKERIDSLTWRLMQEDLFGQKAKARLLFGWGAMGRAWPVDPHTGEQLIQMIDSLWVIILSKYGLTGLFGFYASHGFGAFLVLGSLAKKRMGLDERNDPFTADAIILSLVLCFYLVDSLMNAMPAPIYTLFAGALMSNYLRMRSPTQLPGPGALEAE